MGVPLPPFYRHCGELKPRALRFCHFEGAKRPKNLTQGKLREGAKAWQSRWGVGLCSLASGFCSCLIHQAQLPNKLGNYSFKLRLAMTEGGVPRNDRGGAIAPRLLSLRAEGVAISEESPLP